MAQTKVLPIRDIQIPEKDYPESGNYPPDSPAFTELKNSISKHGMLNPVVINPQKVCLIGHYRLWAAEDLGWKQVPVIVVKSLRAALGLPSVDVPIEPDNTGKEKK